MKNMKITKKARNQDVQLRLGCLAAGLLHALHALHGEKRNGGSQALRQTCLFP